mmetsp:Transcript_44460/g.107583  ORF Transcript_44460/g.107583 Transcript_44460/m.107583 type:complete len:160 (+) Transcript_44460:941-1420(+)
MVCRVVRRMELDCHSSASNGLSSSSSPVVQDKATTMQQQIPQLQYQMLNQRQLIPSINTPAGPSTLTLTSVNENDQEEDDVEARGGVTTAATTLNAVDGSGKTSAESNSNGNSSSSSTEEEFVGKGGPSRSLPSSSSLSLSVIVVVIEWYVRFDDPEQR